MSLRTLSFCRSSDPFRGLAVSAGLALAAAMGCGLGANSKLVAASRPASKAESRGTVAPSSPLLALVELEGILGSDAHELSGTYYDSSTRALYALSDRSRRLACLKVSPDYRSLSPCDGIPLDGSQSSQWDGEALTWKGGEFYVVANETNAEVERFDNTGRFGGKVPIRPAFYDRVLDNKGLESLTISPTGKALFVANEFALRDDPTDPSTGTIVRILRRSFDGGSDMACVYRTEPYRGQFGVSEMLALSDTELLVLERDYVVGEGNTVRLFHVELGEENLGPAGACGPEVLSPSPLKSSVPVLAKTLVLDFSSLPSQGVPHPGLQRNNILDNYEALALGPRLEDGRYILFVTSDDNGNATQVARTLVLALDIPRGSQSREETIR